MDDMGIAGVAMDMSAIRLQSEISMRVMKMALDVTDQVADELTDLMAEMTGAGANIDVSV